jgi:hypothetical protein
LPKNPFVGLLRCCLPETAGLDTCRSIRLTREGGLVPLGAADARRMLGRSDRPSQERDRTSPPTLAEGANASAAWTHARAIDTPASKLRRRSRMVGAGIWMRSRGRKTVGMICWTGASLRRVSSIFFSLVICNAKIGQAPWIIGQSIPN